MASTLPDRTLDRHPVLPDIGPKTMAKVAVRVPDINYLEAIGQAIQRMVWLVGLSNKEAAARIGVDDAEFGKWLNGTRRPQLDKVFAVAEFRQPLVICLAQLVDGVEVETTIRVKRRV